MTKNREMQGDEIFALKSPQRSQSLALLATAYEPAPPSIMELNHGQYVAIKKGGKLDERFTVS